MKDITSYFFIIAFLIFSFFYTEKIISYVQTKDPLYESINSKKNNYNIEYVDSIIDENTIIPGLNGLKIDVRDSFFNMKSINTFNEKSLIYEEVQPKISLEDNKDKTIISGNKQKKSISLIFEGSKYLGEYKNYNVDLLSNKDTKFYNGIEYINNETEKEYFDYFETLLNKYKINKDICIINSLNKNICKSNKKYLIKPSLTLNNSNLIKVKNNIDNGSIILIKDTASIQDINLLIKYIESKDINIVFLSKLISEKR